MSSPTTATESHRGLRGFACEPCARRKVRCDRLQPCCNCKRRPNDACVYTVPEPKRGVKRQRSSAPQDESSLLSGSKWTNCGDLVEGPSRNFIEARPPARPRSPDPARLLFQQTMDSNVQNLSSYHPTPDQIGYLWRAYLKNVYPITIYLVAWQRERMVDTAIQQLQSITPAAEAFLFVMYSLSVYSLEEEECRSNLGATKSELLDHYQAAAEYALPAAGLFRSPDIYVLQSFVMYLMLLRDRTDTNTFWVLVGAAVRVAERLGLDREESVPNLPPFEIELRRRLWWQIIKLDDLAAQKSGGRSVCSRSDWNARLPSNIEDQDLRPDMTWASAIKVTPGVIMHGLVQCEILNYHYNLKRTEGGRTGETWFRDDAVSVEEKENAIESLERSVQDRFLRYYDPLVPSHFLTTIMMKSISCNTRLAAHYQQGKNVYGVSLPRSEKDLMFTLAQRAVELDLLCATTEAIKGFRWHTENYYPWMALVILLTDLYERPQGQDVEEAWHTISKTYDTHPRFTSDLSKPIHVAVADLVLKAWQSKAEDPGARQGWMPDPAVPGFVQRLREQRRLNAKTVEVDCPPMYGALLGSVVAKKEPETPQPQQPLLLSTMYGDVSLNPAENSSTLPITSQTQDQPYAFAFGELANIDFSTLDWDQWENLITSDMSFGEWPTSTFLPG